MFMFSAPFHSEFNPCSSPVRWDLSSPLYREEGFMLSQAGLEKMSAL